LLKITPKVQFIDSDYDFAKQLKDEDIEDLEDDLEEDFMREYQKKRMEEMKAEA
jgi:hypothetical protein